MNGLPVDDWLAQSPQLAHTLRGLQPGRFRAVFEPGPYYYWRLCVDDVEAVQEVRGEVEEDIVRAVAADRQLASVVLVNGKEERLLVGLCDDPKALVHDFCTRMGLQDGQGLIMQQLEALR